MPENGQPVVDAKRPAGGAEWRRLLLGHLELGRLEGGYEVRQAIRRVLFLGAGAAAGLTAYVFAQVALLRGLAALGLPIGGAALVLAACYGLLAVGLAGGLGRRDSRVQPFRATREELTRTLQWIRNRF